MEMPRARPRSSQAAGPTCSAELRRKAPGRARELARSVDLRCLLALLPLSALFEAAFVHHGLNPVDEGWPLYAAMLVQEGATLYREAFFVFPPGHLLPAWLGQAFDPPGLIVARWIYAGFSVALVLSLYLLGRRLMPAPFALLGAAMVAVATPDSHVKHLLFGYRYLVWSVLALLALDRGLRSGGSRWMGLAGFLAGTALCFRLTPGAAVCAGLGAAVLAAPRPWQRGLRDAGWLVLGASLALLPVLGWLSLEVGPASLWREIVVRPIEMMGLQSKPIPALALSGWSPDQWQRFFVALLFRICALTYLAYLLVLLLRWLRSLARWEAFDQPLLLAVAVWAGVYFTRSLGRSDEPHLASTLPPFCLLAAHAAHLGVRRLADRWPWAGPRVGWAAAAGIFGLWALASGSLRVFDPAFLGAQPLAALDGAVRSRPGHRWVDAKVERILEHTRPGDRILVMGPQAMLYVLSSRRGPGQADVVMPGTFRNEAEELSFVARLERDPPAVIVPQWPFDGMLSRSPVHTAPRLSRWVQERYELVGKAPSPLLLPRSDSAGRSAGGRRAASASRAEGP